MIEEPRSLPDVILPPFFKHKIIDIEPVGLKIEPSEFGRPILYSEDGEIIENLFEWLLGKEAYTVLPGRGEFDSIFKNLSHKELTALAMYGKASIGEIQLSTFGRDGSLTVRRGNKWGRLNNLVRLCPDLETPKQFRLAAELTLAKFYNYGFPEVPLRSVGQTIQDMVLQHVRMQARPPGIHLDRFAQSFKAARMEGVIFGKSEVFDYDISSAYPSFVSELVTTNRMVWLDVPEIVEDAAYGAARCDVEISNRLVRGPFAVRYGTTSVYFPVGNLKGIWLGKPEIDLLLEFPEVGRITKVYEASWGITPLESYPFSRMMRKLYSIRRNDEFLSGFAKFAMVALWGKFISSYKVRTPDSEYLQSSCLYNPVFASHVTSRMRCDLFRKSFGREVIGEFVDGLTVSKQMASSKGFGGFLEQGRGELVLFSDQYKGSSWKNEDLLRLAETQKDKKFLDVPFETRYTLESAFRYGGVSEARYLLGRKENQMSRIHLGSTMRILDDDLVVGDFLEGSFGSYPPNFEDIKGLRFLKSIERSY